MAKFMCTHEISPEATPGEHLRQFAQALQDDPTVTSYRSFANLADHRAICVLEAASEDAAIKWFNRMGLPVDRISRVELEEWFTKMALPPETSASDEAPGARERSRAN